MAGLLSRRAFLKTTVAAVPVLTGLYAWRIEPEWLEITHRDLPIAHLPPQLTGKTLVQLSDIHIGPQVDDDYIRRTFAAMLADVSAKSYGVSCSPTPSTHAADPRTKNGTSAPSVNPIRASSSTDKRSCQI